MRSNYWTCSKFADWLRGTPKPEAASSEAWDEWNIKAKAAHPFRFWLSDDALDTLQKTIFWPTNKLYDIKYYINNRWVTRSHCLTAHSRDIKPGNWQDVGNRFLPCLFNELVDFVEVELAWWHIVWDDEAYKKFKAPWYASGWWRWRTWRSPEAALANLEWQRKLVWKEEEVGPDHKNLGQPTQQSINAQEILELYTWWTTVYHKRPDPCDASGWSDYCEARRLANGGKLSFSNDKSPELKKTSNKALKLLQKIEEDYEKEDEEMLIRLIKIRQSLWT